VTWKGKRGKRVRREDADFEHLRACQRVGAVDHPTAIGDDNHAGRACLGDMKHADEIGHLHRKVDLFHTFPRRGDRGVLVVIDKSAW
jgi:hypothetical protein